MNLIEKYGSYDAAKAKQQELSKIAADPQLLLVGKIIKEIGEIEIALLEYRRQHNIFEHGDYIVWLFDCEPAHLYTVKHITDKGCDYGNDWGWYGVLSNKGVGHNFRHATDEEIKAGKRLEVNDGNSN